MQAFINSRVHLLFYAHLIIYMYIKSANLRVISNKIIITNYYYYYYYYSIWSEAQPHLPKNIYNFTIRYINNWQDRDYHKVLIAPFAFKCLKS